MTPALEPIPIFVMSYNDYHSLRLCLRALHNRTQRPHTVTVVDNASSDRKLVRYLHKIGQLTRVHVVRNKFNFWVLGLNRSVRSWAASSGPEALFAVTDCDVLVPPRKNGLCWLTRLEAQLNHNASIGKLGLSLDLGYIKNRAAFQHTYEREVFFMQGPRIGEAIIAPVDTTMALYRKTAFVTRLPLFVPPHQSLYRPYFYCCRTSDTLQARHLSWRFYGLRNETDVVAKMRCFAVVGATVVPAVYNAAPPTAKLFYRLVRPLARAFWGIVVIALQAGYVMRNFPRNLNALQTSRRA